MTIKLLQSWGTWTEKAIAIIFNCRGICKIVLNLASTSNVDLRKVRAIGNRLRSWTGSTSRLVNDIHFLDFCYESTRESNHGIFWFRLVKKNASTIPIKISENVWVSSSYSLSIFASPHPIWDVHIKDKKLIIPHSLTNKRTNFFKQSIKQENV